MFFKIALLNIIKHYKRSLVVLIAVVIAVLVMSVVSGAIRGLTESFTNNLLPESGHIQVKIKDYKLAANPFDLDLLLPEADRILESLDHPAITIKEKILGFGALILEAGNSDLTKEVKNLGMFGQGIRADTQYFQNIRNGILAGDFLVSDPREILLSKKTADLLDLRIGQGVIVLTQDSGGNPWYQEFVLKGVFATTNGQLDENFFFIHHSAAEELLDVAGRTRELRISLNDSEASFEVLRALQPALEKAGAQGETWQTTFGSILTIVKFVDVVNVIINVFFIIVASSVITNSILMTVFQRIREYGTLRAIGLRRSQIFGMIVTEGAVLGAIGSLLGLALGLPVLFYFKNNGLDIGSATEYFGVGSKFFFAIHPAGLLLAFLSGIAVAVLASLYAARVSSKLTVTESLSHI